MARYDKFYKDNGNRKIAHFLNPRIINAETFEFPYNTMLYWNKPTSIIHPFTSELGFMQNESRVYVEVKPNYTNGTIGSFNNRSITDTDIIKQVKRDEKSFKYLKPNQQNLNISSKHLLVFHYGALTYLHKYTANALAEYYKWYNNMLTIISDLKSDKYKTDRQKFLFISLPKKLPSRVELEKHSKKITSSTLNVFITKEYFDILDIWKFLTPKLKEESLLGKLTIEEMKQIDLLFYIDNKLSLLNLYLLYATVSEYKESAKIKSYNSEMMKKGFYKLIYSIVTAPGKGVDEMTEEDEEDVVISNKISDAKTESEPDSKKVNIDDVLEDEVIEKDLEVKIVDHGDEDTDEEYDLSASEINDTLEDVDVSDYADVESVISEEPVLEDKITKEIKFLLENKIITKKKADDIEATISEQKKKPSPFKNNSSTVGEMLDVKSDNFTINEEDTKISSNKVVFMEEHNTDTLSVVKKTYIKEHYEKDILRTIYSLQNNAIVVNDYEIEEKESVLGKTERHSITINALNGRPSTVKIDLPKIEDDGTFKLSGNTYKMISQRADLPLRKIDATRVALSSYYGKLFVDKAYAKKDDLGYWLRKKILEIYETSDDLRDLILLPVENMDVKLPKLYGVLSRYIKSFRYKSYLYNFDYSNRQKLFKDLKEDEIKKIESNDVIIVGVKGNSPIVTDFDNRIFIYENGSFKEVDDIVTMLGIDKQKMPMEFSSVKIYKKSIPTVVLLSYYFGLDKLLRMLKVKYTITETGKRVEVSDKQFVVKFKDKKLVIDRDFDKTDLILAGLSSMEKITKNLNFDVFNKRDKFSAFFTMAEFTVLYINEIKMLENMYVDPMTESNLRLMKEPLRFKGLLIRANEMLTDDTYTNPNNINQMSIKGYERVAGMLYSELVKGMKEHENRSHFGKSKINIAPHAILNKINEDSTTILVDDINPMAELKQDEKVTYLGDKGRSKEGIGRATREMHSSEIGVISEASPDSGDVGISAYLTATPAISNTRGKSEDMDIKGATNNNILSTTAMLAPFSDKDDVKRTNFSNIMASHIIPMDNMAVPYVRTGYEAIVPIRFSEKYVKIARDSGAVKDVTPKNITVEYKSGKTEKIALKKWTSKEESESTYTHIMLSNVTKGQKFGKDDTIAYDSLFFEPDIFNPARVIYKQSANVTVALLEDPQTYEDSGAISKRMYKDLGTTVTKVKSIVVSKDDNILNMIGKNSKVEPSDVLFTITDSILNNSKLDERSMAILQDMKSNSPKAKVKGMIDEIVVYYNCEKDELSKSLQDIVTESDKNIKSNTGNTGKVDSSYSIKGIPLQKDEVEIKIYIKVGENMGVGDKAILGNQLKFTVGEVYDYNIDTLDGDSVDLLFSAKSIAARIVNSPDLMGTAGMCLERISENAVDIYFNA